MKRTKNSSGVSYKKEDEPIILSKALVDILLKQDRPCELIALYTFYYYTAKWQKTNQPKVTVDYISRGLGWSIERVRKYRKQLINLNLIEDIIQKSSSGLISGHFVKVNFVWSINQPHGIPDGGINHGLEHPKRNALNSNNKNIKEDDFDKFWKIYPRKIGKGKALTAWIKLTKRKEAPTIDEVIKSVLEQSKTQQWQTAIYIPHPTTWINERRWLDDPGEMKIYKRESDQGKYKPSKVMEYGEWWFLNEDDGKYYNKQGKLLM